MRFLQIFTDAVKNENKLLELREAVINLRAEGVDKETLLSELSQFRNHTDSDETEDVVLEVMDFLAGFCSPHMRID
jgi:hypothetical protein